MRQTPDQKSRSSAADTVRNFSTAAGPRAAGETVRITTPILWRPVLWHGVTILCAAAAVAWLLDLLVARNPVRSAWSLQVMFALAVLLASVWGAVQRCVWWTTPVQKLQALLPMAQRGEVPIEELSTITGGPAALVPALQDVLRELRQQRAAVAELEAEIHQRVANRTDALERTIGSLRTQATRDALTGLFNRRFLDQFLPQAVQRHARERNDLCLLMIDVDNFKTLNDTLGHAAGDELLKAVGQLIRSSIRGEDVAFRCGGDEFVVLLPGVDEPAGRALAQRLTSLVDALGRTLHVPLPPRLSIGVATLTSLKAPCPHTLLEQADRSLYEVKDARRAVRPGRAALTPPAVTTDRPRALRAG